MLWVTYLECKKMNMKVYRPLQVSFNSQVLEQNRRFYFITSASLGINLQTGDPLLDVDYLKDMFEAMGENALPDTGMPKPNGEFLVSGSFFSRDNHAVTGGKVKVRLGSMEKELYVFGPRKWQQGFPSPPDEIISMPIAYSKAFGGNGFKLNPDGMGYNDGFLPCIENPEKLISSRGETPEPACFSPRFFMHPDRMVFQGTYGADYMHKYFPGYPEDHDWKYFLCAPRDQWIQNFFTGDESYELHNMHPDIPVIKGRFPGLFPRCFINQKKGDKISFGELDLKLDTIWFFPEKMLGLLIWRGVLETGDDEASEISHVLAAYEDGFQESRSVTYYKEAFEKRRNKDDALLNNLNTQDLIPENHKCAMVLLMEAACEGDPESEFAKNLDAKAKGIEEMVDEKIEKAIQDVENDMGKIDIPKEALAHASDEVKTDKGGFDIRKMMGQQDKLAPDSDAEEFKSRLEAILPGITAGDLKQLDMKNFSFEKIDRIMEAVDELAGKKEKKATDIVSAEIEKAKGKVKEQIDAIDIQIEKARQTDDLKDPGRIAALENVKKQIDKSLTAMDDIDARGSSVKAPLPRVNAEKIMMQIKQADVQLDPVIIEAMQHAEAIKASEGENQKTKELERKIQEQVEDCQKQMEDSLKQTHEAVKEGEKSFKEGYIMAAHFMGEGLSPHKVSLDEVRSNFLDAVSKGKNVSGKDFACIDLSGENLDGIDLSGAYLEQVNFKNASLRNANLSEAILVRANLEGADCTGVNFKKANIGAVHALQADFTGADFAQAKLSKGDYTKSNFTKANLEDIESLEIIINQADFTGAYLPKLIFMEIQISGANFENADLNTSVFLRCGIENSNFSQSVMNSCVFVDTALKNICFEKADLSNACFTAVESENLNLETLKFKGACLKQANFQHMTLKNSDFTYSNIENAFFGETDLSGADLSYSLAQNAQFRKAILTGAKLDRINLDKGSLAKANLVGASFKGANLHAVDFLRSTITDTDFFGSNLDNTLIKNWRPA